MQESGLLIRQWPTCANKTMYNNADNVYRIHTEFDSLNALIMRFATKYVLYSGSQTQIQMDFCKFWNSEYC